MKHLTYMSNCWIDKGLIYKSPLNGGWRDNSALTPTPICLNEGEIRIYCGMRDIHGISRIGYVDVESENPDKIIRISEKPALDIGEPGNFDDNGVILGDVLKFEDKVYMFYVGFQLTKKVKFLAYSGLAISHDNGLTFDRIQKTPILERSPEALFIRAIHSVIIENGVWRVWYSTGSSWQKISDKYYPCYDINYLESVDGRTFSNAGLKCILNDEKNNEYRIGRPRVHKIDNFYVMNFTFGTIDGRYEVGQAKSLDGVEWHRDDTQFGIKPGKSSWTSDHLCYPAYLHRSKKDYIFYNGNNMGYEGFGYAILND